jgi:4-hydroxy-tetrahydrodipicolinate synthase
MLWGATCALIGLGAARVDLSINLLRAHMARDAATFLQFSAAVDQFAQATFITSMEGYIRRMLWALVVEGVILEDASYDPFGPLVPSSELNAVQHVLESLKRQMTAVI